YIHLHLHLQTLTKLSVGGKQIGAVGAKYFADALQNNETLKLFYLQDSNIGYTGAQYLADALRHNKTLWTVLISRMNNISSSLLEKLKQQDSRFT
ncbi:unnamed protein product, partial [Rotaria socialis]